MATQTARRSGGTSRAATFPYFAEAAATVLLAALLGYVLHHTPPLRDHALLGVAFSVLTAGAIAFGLGALMGRRAAYQLPTVVVAPRGGPQLRSLSREDLEFCAALHAETLPHGFFVRLGPRFLRSYYATFLESPHAVALAASISPGAQPIGALVGILDPRAHARWVLRHRGPALALRGALAMVLHPGTALRFLRTRLGRYARAWRQHRGEPAPRASGGAPAVLSHVAVLPGGRGTGAGRVLVSAFEARARAAGVARAVLTTLEPPRGAGAFYEALGWQYASSTRTADGQRVEVWERDLSAGATQ